MADRTIKVRLEAQVDNLVSGLKKGRQSVEEFSQASAKTQASGEAWRGVANGMAVGGVALAAGLGSAVGSFISFDKAMSAAKAATGGTAEQMNALRAAAIDAGSKTQYSATEAAQGITELAKAGISTTDILGGGLNGALSLAAAGQMEVGDAAETAASAMNQFGLAGSDVGHIADVLANGANAAQGSVKDMGDALNQTGVVAAGMGMSLDDTATALTAFASAGLTGSDAGTSLKTMLQRLAAPTKEAQAAMDGLGLTVYDAQGKFVGMQSIFEQLNVATAGLSTEQQNLALTTIFGADAVRAAGIAADQGAAGFKMFAAEVTKAGGASETAAALTDNLAGDWERLTGSIETAAISTGSSLNTLLRGTVQAADGIVQSVGKIPAPILAASAGLGALVLVGPKIVNAFSQSKQTLRDLGISVDDIAKKSPRAASAVEKLAAGAGKLMAFTAATQALGAAGVYFGEVERGAKESTASLEAFLAKGKDAPGMTANMKAAFADLPQTIDYTFGKSSQDKVGNFVESVVTGFGALDDTLATRGAKAFREIDSAMSQMVSGGNLAGAQTMFATLRAEFEKQGIPLARLKDALPQYSAALDAASAASSGASSGIAQAGTAAQDAGAKFETAADALKAFSDRLQMIAGTFSVEAAMDAAAAAADGLAKSVSDSTRSLSGQTEGARQNREAMRGLVDASLAVVQAMADQGASAGDVAAKATQLAAGIDAAGAKAGLSAGEVKRYSDALRQVPEVAETTIGADVGQAQSSLDGLQSTVDALVARRNLFKVGADTTQAVVGVSSLSALAAAAKADITVGANTSSVGPAIGSAVAKANASSGTMTINGNAAPALGMIQTAVGRANASTGIFTLKSNAGPALSTLQSAVGRANASSGTMTVKGNNAPALGSIQTAVGRANASSGVFTLKGNNSPAMGAISSTVSRANSSSGTVTVRANTGSAESAISWLTRARTAVVNVVQRISGALGFADGGIIHAYADGGIENHVAQIAPAGAWRMWAEPETGGEAYIPLASAKRVRSKTIVEEVVRTFGGSVQWNADGNVYRPAPLAAMRAAAPASLSMPDGLVDALRDVAAGQSGDVVLQIDGRTLLRAQRSTSATFAAL